MTGPLLWPDYATPADLAAIEAVPLEARGLPESTYALLARAATRWPDRTALNVLPDATRWNEPQRRTFAELLADVHRVANLLHGLGVRRGDAVALMSPNCAELITATLAAQLAGIAAPLGGGLSRQHLAELLRRSGARVLVTAGPELAPATWNTAQALAGDGLLDVILVLRPTGADGEPEPLPAIDGVRVGYLGELAAAQDAAAFDGELPRSVDLAAMFHTGGTTGAPKLAAHTHANEVADAWMLAASNLFDQETVVFAALPLFHVNALVVTLLAPLFKGQTVVWAGPLGYRDPALFGTFWKVTEHYRIAAMSAVPTVYATLAQVPVDADISSLRFPMVGASPLPAAVRDSFQAHTGVALTEGYGLTEATCASARTFPDAPRPGSVGQRLPYQRVRVVAVDGTWDEQPVGETGILAISGPTVFPGYVIDRDENGPVLDGLGKLVDGWLDTGDLGRVDEDGFVHLAGRAKDLIIRGGHNIDPATIEDTLLTHPQVTAASAVGRPDVHAGEVPVAYVTLTPGATVAEEELGAWARERVPDRAAAPRTVTVLDELPLTAVGKLYKLGLRADAVRRELHEALDGIDGVQDIEATIEGSSIVATVNTSPSAEDAVKATLGRYAIDWRLVVTS
ncbi:acyl-CoA synthetase [Micromonospora sp. PPF5-17]|uniref:Acyl-CoA synthetase n=1 Tax=Micromonospora solifontis TaxID=2487138 RepID=A0ABX9WEI8_9ACTN|nr:MULTISPECIES: acyl-CoA synthetase [Micromonospora]NES37540.1 acyl-CoA synthetase [Micromonospora solifontis]NES58238.1 acyl-CoA synthetase [Micromonospora sp. PPF5-6]RNL98255.1 acyl-CoA synthetase [Micromonospora solifontis]